jgi:hypothetical protein
LPGIFKVSKIPLSTTKGYYNGITTFRHLQRLSYLPKSAGSATGLASMLDYEVSYDKVILFLNNYEGNAKLL